MDPHKMYMTKRERLNLLKYVIFVRIHDDFPMNQMVFCLHFLFTFGSQNGGITQNDVMHHVTL